MFHISHKTFYIDNFGSLWQRMGERAKGGKEDNARQSLLLSCCKPLFLFSFIFLKRRMLAIKFRNLRHCCPTTCLVCLPQRVQPLSSVCGSPTLYVTNAVLRDFTLFLHYQSLLSFFLIYCNRLFSVSFPYSVVWKTCTFMRWG